MTLKTRDIVGPKKHVEYPIVILEEEHTISDCSRRIKSWDEIRRTCLDNFLS